MRFDGLNNFYFIYSILLFISNPNYILPYISRLHNYIYYPNMIKIIKTLFNPKLIITPSARFSDVWKDRDDAAEKVYITRTESTRCIMAKDRR